MAGRIAIAVTVFHTADATLTGFFSSLAAAADGVRRERPGSSVELIVVDNSVGGQDGPRLRALLATAGASLAWRLLTGHGNVGYGAANNLALLRCDAAYLIVANPDLVIAEDALVRLLDAFEAHPEAGLISPCFVEDGRRGHLCKRYPSLAVVLGRGFLPDMLRKPIARQLRDYGMGDRSPDEDFWDPLTVSGAFMAFRSAVFKAVGGFDERFFLHFEDVDLSLRVAAKARLFYASSVEMQHGGGYTARRGWPMIAHFGRSAIRFWAKHGFRLLSVTGKPG